MRAKKHHLNRYPFYDELLEILYYNLDTGEFRWKIAKQKIQIGQIAGCKNDKGYVHITINGIPFLAHILAWYYVYGYIPKNQIDHKDRIKHHNWIDNLREVSNSGNQQNTGNQKNNTSGIKGVSWYKQNDKWMSYIYVNDKTKPEGKQSTFKNLGYYNHFYNAVCARLAAEQCLDWEGCNLNSPAYLYVAYNIRSGGELGWLLM